MKMTPKEYGEMAKKASPPSKSGKNLWMAFLIGGLICAIGEGLRLLYQKCGLSLETAYTAVSVSLVFLSILLTGLDVYDDIAKVGGAGTLVPITGFANAMASPAIEFKSEGFILGLGAKLFVISGPVIVYGTVASIIYGLIFWLSTIF